MKGWCLEYGRVGSRTPLCWVGPNYPHILETDSICKDLKVLLQFAHPLRITAFVLWFILLFRWKFGWLKVGMLFILSVCRRRALPFLPFVLGLLGRSSTFQKKFHLKQLWQHLLKGIDRFLLCSNHIELFSLDSGLLFELPGHTLGSSCHVSKSCYLRSRIQRLIFSDGRVLIIHLTSLG